MASKVKWGTSLLELLAMGNVTMLLVEIRTWIDRKQVIPYLTSFHQNLLRELKEWTETGICEVGFLVCVHGFHELGSGNLACRY